jgi:hypothetical protein
MLVVCLKYVKRRPINDIAFTADAVDMTMRELLVMIADGDHVHDIFVRLISGAFMYGKNEAVIIVLSYACRTCHRTHNIPACGIHRRTARI